MKEVLKRRLVGGVVVLGVLLLLWSLFRPAPPDTSLPPVPKPPAFKPLNLPADFGGAASPARIPAGDAPPEAVPAEEGEPQTEEESPLPVGAQAVPPVPASPTDISPVPRASVPPPPRAAEPKREEKSGSAEGTQERASLAPVRWRVRVGVYARPQRMMEQLRTDGFSPSREIWRVSDKGLLYAVYAGDGLPRWRAEELRQEVDRRYEISSQVERVERGVRK